MDTATKFWSKVAPTGFCWLWVGGLTAQGYGRFKDANLTGRQAHRHAYTLLVGPIPDGLTLDHLCRIKTCVNPDHLEPVTQEENTRRHFRLRTHCKHGHKLSREPEGNLRAGRQYCKVCDRNRKRAKRAGDMTD